MKKVIFLPQAEEEMNDAALFYESHRQSLGREFLKAMKRGTDDIGRNPQAYPIQLKGIRRRLIQRFPYGVLYCEEEDQVVIIAVMHLHRAPDYWRHRVSEQAGKWD